MIQEQTGKETSDAPRPLDTRELVDFLIGHALKLHYTVTPLDSWPCRLVAAIAEASSRTAGLGTCSWKREMNTGAVSVQHEVTVRALSGDRLPDTFAAEVFAALVGATCVEQSDGSLSLADMMGILLLDPDDTRNYALVRAAIGRLSGLSIHALSYVRHNNRAKPDRYVEMFRLIPSHSYPSEGDIRISPMRVEWKPTVYKAIIAPLSEDSGGGSLSSK